MTHADLQTLARWMAGQFDNLEQSQRDPAWFVALRLWCQPLPPPANAVLNHVAGTEGAIGLFVEQAPLPAGDKPYRQRLFLLCPAIADRAAIIEYFGFQDQRPYIGAGLDPSRLAAINHDAIQTLNNARFPLLRSGDRFISRGESDQVCSFKYGEQQGHVSLGFEISATQWLSFDRGIDPQTGQGQWGALMGPYELKKREGYGA
ncbi:MAG: chorismate mutase [Oscillatoriales cyanobacterium]|nr:MAG: chorismate mutase [Oscillatoriales cyanobacterium]